MFLISYDLWITQAQTDGLYLADESGWVSMSGSIQREKEQGRWLVALLFDPSDSKALEKRTQLSRLTDLEDARYKSTLLYDGVAYCLIDGTSDTTLRFDTYNQVANPEWPLAEQYEASLLGVIGFAESRIVEITVR